MTTTPAPDLPVIEGEVVSTTTDAPAPPAAAAPPMAGGHQELKPLLPGWARSYRDLDITLTGLVRRGAHRGTWHGIRLPLYAGRLIAYAPRGAARLLVVLWNIISDGEAQPLRHEAVVGHDPKVWLALRRERNERVRRRLIVASTITMPAVAYLLAALAPDVAGLVGALLVFGVVARVGGTLHSLGVAAVLAGLTWFGLPQVLPPLPLPPVWSVAGAAVLGVLVLGYIGRPIGKPLVKPASIGNAPAGPLRPDVVIGALVRLGINGMTPKTQDEIRLLMDVAREGPGYRVDLELPPGVPAAQVMERRSPLSSALRREIGCVWPEVGKRHEGHLALYVSDQDMSSAKQAPWPLLKAGTVNVFKPAPAFTDQRGRWVDITLAYTSGVIGAVPRMGKTFSLRELLLIGGLDTRSRVYAYDLKGSGDLSPCALYAYRYGVGDEDEEVRRHLGELRELREEMRRRYRVLRDLPREVARESKVTDELASKRELGLFPIVLGVDECQVWFEYGKAEPSDKAKKAIREEFIAICTDLVKRGPAAGIICYFATQKPSATSIPRDISANATVRLCFKVESQVENDQVLGTSAYKMGLRATMFEWADKGVAYFKGEGASARIVRTVAGLDAVVSEKVAMRARDARVAVGMLAGYAADEEMGQEAEQVALLDDARTVFEGTERLHLEALLQRLAGLRPALYAHMDVKALGVALRAAGVDVRQVMIEGVNRWGVRREALDVAATATIGDEDEGGEVIPMR